MQAAVGIYLVLQSLNRLVLVLLLLLHKRVVRHSSVVLMQVMSLILFVMIILKEGLDLDTAFELGHGIANNVVLLLFVMRSFSHMGELMAIVVLALNVVGFLVVNGLVMSLWVLILMELGTINGFVDSMLMVVNGLNVVLGIELMV